MIPQHKLSVDVGFSSHVIPSYTERILFISAQMKPRAQAAAPAAALPSCGAQEICTCGGAARLKGFRSHQQVSVHFKGLHVQVCA